MAVLVTGCAGLIGSQVAALLAEQGEEVVGVDNLNSYYLPRLKRHRLDGLAGRPGFRFVELDVTDGEAVEGLFAGQPFESVLHLAAMAGVRYSIRRPREYVLTNVLGTMNVLESMRRHQSGRLVLASTSSLYAGLGMPFVETLPVNEPLSPYAASKKGAEALAWTWHHLYGIHVAVVRYFTVYGPAGRPDMAYFRFIHQIESGQPLELFGDGSQARDFTHVRDIARGTVAARRSDGFEVYNLGGNDPLTVSTMIGMIEQITGKRAAINEQPFHNADMKATWANIDKAGAKLGWRPEIRLEEGLRDCVAWYRRHRELARDAVEAFSMTGGQ